MININRIDRTDLEVHKSYLFLRGNGYDYEPGTILGIREVHKHKVYWVDIQWLYDSTKESLIFDFTGFGHPKYIVLTEKYIKEEYDRSLNLIDDLNNKMNSLAYLYTTLE
jgi:hypothetical protein